MLINWFTVCAQIVNFLILAWLLKRFLYKPILGVMQERQLQILTQIQEAEKAKIAANEQQLLLVKKNEDFESDRNEKLKSVIAKIEERKKQMTNDLRAEIDALRERWRENLVQEHEAFDRELSVLVQHELFAMTRKMFSDLADSSVEERIIEVFSRRLQKLSPDEKEKLIGIRQNDTSNIVIKSAFELSEEGRNKIFSVFEVEGINAKRFSFQNSPEIICGVEALIGGCKISWTALEYTLGLEEKVRAFMEQEKHGES
ncbi:MAG: hypothetical protein HQM08_04890 [Candidatus Riflebacteria bacterium]|nr:hypothetical protein [Candidatus Riflebacteria bacterium]